MKTTFVFAALMLSALAAHAESLTLNIPFAFAVPGKTLPAGEYSIKTLPGSAGVLSIQGAGSDAIVFGRIIPANPETLSKASVAFKESSLVTVTMGGVAFEVNKSDVVKPEPVLTASAE